jgi:hypothetical protein
MQTSFNWAFGILTVFAVGVVTRAGFPTSYLSFFLLSVALVLLTQFFVRTAKDYLNQIRFAALEKICLACLFSLNINANKPQLEDVAKGFDIYFVQWKSPKPLGNVIRKTLFDHGYFALYVVVLTLLIWVGVSMNWNDVRPIGTLVAVVVLMLITMKDFGGFYFHCDSEEESMKGKD